ncbi:hypothetical protein DICPUDRAFT_148855 [Dictyostelium purpureum]|uniref:Uncharacterized protein n=1 Tax=Dictyostelium purpureum TaxID=5786 RepID=F0ZC64_DICPU|nr:uncharacterized protein DICPUDRAFT_148855 [Dictyostelium purpureum]EGC38442.1 hypothetical protein DICPUDRAFT_148855 [Dictyostelium purpureum]|eukprot:XP_003285000.1 hypothetical protein DICPUDRAFT_148855 [Dictyostelium purpureum]
MSTPDDIEFKAGKAQLVDKTVTSDNRKGFLKFNVTGDGLILVSWRPRDSSAYEDEFYFAPGELKFVKVEACKTGRMYYLNFSDSNHKEFFWLQEPDASKDAKIEKAIKLIEDFVPMDDDQMPIDSTPAPNQTSTQPTAPTKQPETKTNNTATPAPSSTGYISTPSQSVNKSSATTSETPSQIPNMDLFKDIFSKLPAQPKQPQVTLGKIMTAENLIPFLRDNPSIKQDLLQHLPEECAQDPSKLNEILYSPQFLQSLETLDYAIFEGHGAEIISLLGYEPTLASQRGVEGFLTNIQEECKKKQKK